MITDDIEYRDGDTLLKGFYAYDDSNKAPKAGVLVAHDWSGRNPLTLERAKQLAELGYVGFAIDMYGNAKLGKSKEENMALITPFLQDRKLLLQRILAAFNTLKKLPMVNPNKIGAIGFCFGGLCVLDLARGGTDLNGVVSFHGLLNAPENLPHHKILAKLLVLHGYDDPMVKPDQMLAFCQEMTAAKADWEVNIYGNTMHGFTNPEANDPNFGTVYNKQTSTRAFLAMANFLQEVFA